MKKRFVFSIATLLLIASIFVGCGSKAIKEDVNSKVKTEENVKTPKSAESLNNKSYDALLKEESDKLSKEFKFEKDGWYSYEEASKNCTHPYSIHQVSDTVEGENAATYEICSVCGAQRVAYFTNFVNAHEHQFRDTMVGFKEYVHMRICKVCGVEDEANPSHGCKSESDTCKFCNKEYVEIELGEDIYNNCTHEKFYSIIENAEIETDIPIYEECMTCKTRKIIGYLNPQKEINKPFEITMEKWMEMNNEENTEKRIKITNNQMNNK